MNHLVPIMLGALSAVVVSGAAVRAETPEEAVAYAFLGLADKATYSRGNVDLSWNEVSASPAIFTGHGEARGGRQSYDVTFTVTAISDCDYEIALAGPPGMVRGGKTLYARIALAKVEAIAAGPRQVTITGDGFCGTGQTNPDCVTTHATDLFATVDPDKHARLVAELREKVCAAKN